MIAYCPECELPITPRRDGICPECREYRPPSEWTLIAEPDTRSAEERYEQVLLLRRKNNWRWAVPAGLCLFVSIGLLAESSWLALLPILPGLVVALFWSNERDALGRIVCADGELGIWAARDGIISTELGYLNASSTCHHRAKFESGHGMDPRPNLDKAIEYNTKLLEIDPQSGRAHFNLGLVEQDRGRYERMVGQDPETAWLSAVESFREALKDPSLLEVATGDPAFDLTLLGEVYTGSMQQLAWVLTDLASWELERGRDPANRIEEARRLFLRVQELFHSRTTITRDEYGHVSSLTFRPGAYYGMTFNEPPPRGLARLALIEADRERSLGGDPNNAFKEAERILTEALEGEGPPMHADFWRDSGEPGLWREKAELHRRQAAVAEGRGCASVVELDEALVALRRCQTAPEVESAGAEAIAVEGALRMQKSKLTGEGADEARELLEEALAINSNLVHDFGSWLEP